MCLGGRVKLHRPGIEIPPVLLNAPHILDVALRDLNAWHSYIGKKKMGSLMLNFDRLRFETNSRIELK